MDSNSESSAEKFPLINLQTIEKLKALLEDQFSYATGLFIEACTDKPLAMVKALKENNLQEVVSIAHALNGSAGNFGAVELQRLSAMAEKQAGQAEIELLTQTIEKINACSEKTIAAAKALLD